MSISNLSASDIVPLTTSGQVTVRSVVQNCLNAIAAENDKLHALVEVFAHSSIERAEELDRATSTSGADIKILEQAGG